jgi:hypothetical protein
MKNSKKASHVGIVLSFIIFMSFLVFLMYIIEPGIKIKEDKQSILDSVKYALIKKISTQVTTITIYDESVDAECLKVDLSGLNISKSNILVKDKNNKILDSTLKGDFLTFSKGSESDKLIFIFLSTQEFINTTNTNEVCQSTKIKSLKKEDLIFEKTIINTIDKYENNYNDFKEELGISRTINFGFSFTYPNQTTIRTSKKTGDIVYANEIPIFYINDKAEINSGNIVVRVW